MEIFPWGGRSKKQLFDDDFEQFQQLIVEGIKSPDFRIIPENPIPQIEPLSEGMLSLDHLL